MKSRRRFSTIFVAVLFVALSTGAMLAQDDQSYPSSSPQASYPDQSGQSSYPDQGQAQSYPNQQQSQPSDQSYNGQQTQDPPGRVARVQYMSGQVSMQPGGVNDWVAASMNRPLTTADRVWTDKNSKAELNVGDGFLRMNSETSVTLTNVSDNVVQVELDQGTLSVTVKHLEKGAIYEIDTPNYAFTIMKTGTYRFDVYPNEDQSWVTVRSGYGEATGRGNSVRVNSGEQMRFSGGNSLQHVAENAPPRDGFDDWVQVRDKRLDDSLSARYVSPGVIGYQDLDGYGRWVPTPNYGNVWIPSSVPTGWAPYRFGHWAWIAPWGWTWVDDQPWGFAPFHYGRWVNWDGYWGWAPGPMGYWNPYYAPALVGWVGGSGWGVGVGFGGGGWGVNISFGWFPLGWGEPYYPHYCGWGHGGWYRGGGWVSNNYIRNVNVSNTNITNITNITNNYYRGNIQNAQYGFRNRAGAVTGAPRSAFTSGAPINRVGGAVPASSLSRAPMLRNIDANPTRESVLGGRAPQTAHTPPASAFNRPVVTANHGMAPANRPANLEAANQATMARGNMNGVGRGNTSMAATPNAGRPANGAPQNNHINAPANSQAANSNGNNGQRTPMNTGVAQPGRGNPASGNVQANNGNRGSVPNGNEARNQTPTSMGGHYVPRPPSAGGNPTSAMRGGENVGAPSVNNSYGRMNGTQTGYNGNRPPTVGGNNSSVPRPPQAQTGHANSTPTYSAPSRQAPTYSAPHQSGPSTSAPKGNSQSNSNPRGAGMATNVPRPPANYSYRPTQSYTASSGYGNNGRSYPSSYSGNANGNRGYSAPSYNPGRSTASAPAYTPPQRSYGSSPVYSNRGASPSPYSNRGASPAPSYSNRSASPTPNYTANRGYGSAPSYSRGGGSYSAPRPSGGGGGSYSAPRAPSGGGGGHVGGSAGAHSGGGHGR